MMGLSPSLPLRNTSVTASLFSSTSSPPSSYPPFTRKPTVSPQEAWQNLFSTSNCSHLMARLWQHPLKVTSLGSPLWLPPLLNSLWPGIHPHYSVGVDPVKIPVNTMGVSTMISQPQVCLTMAPMRLFWTAIHSGFPREGEKNSPIAPQIWFHCTWSVPWYDLTSWDDWAIQVKAWAVVQQIWTITWGLAQVRQVLCHKAISLSIAFSWRMWRMSQSLWYPYSSSRECSGMMFGFFFFFDYKAHCPLCSPREMAVVSIALWIHGPGRMASEGIVLKDSRLIAVRYVHPPTS